MTNGSGPRRRRGDHESLERRRRRGQLSLAAVEVAVGTLFVLAVAMTFAVGLPTTDAAEAQLDAYASDATTVLANEPPRHAGGTRLSEVARSADAFERERDALERRVERILPENLMFRLETPHGAVGHPRPANVPTGRSAVPTRGGEVVLWVWYA